jgi:hypothetical protein
LRQQGIIQNSEESYNMTKGKAILYITASIALASFGFWLYQKQKVKTLNAKVDSLEDAIKQLQEAKNS